MNVGRRRDTLPPAHWQDFEDLCLKLWRSRLVDAKKNGRAGQPQAGVDIFGRDPKTETWVGIQCKQRGQWPEKVLTVGEIEAEVEQAESFEPPLSCFIVATTSPRDAAMQRFVRELSDERRAEGNFTVDLLVWDDLQDWLQEGPEASLREGLPVISPATRDFTGRTDELKELRQVIGEHGGALSTVSGAWVGSARLNSASSWSSWRATTTPRVTSWWNWVGRAIIR